MKEDDLLGLTPRHDVPVKLLNWKNLDTFLKNQIDLVPLREKNATISLADYEMSTDEIKTELKKNGYKFKEDPKGYLTIY